MKITTRSLRYFDVLDPDPRTVDLHDIAFGLSNLCRFTGQVPFYSVAEHSVLVALFLHDRGHPRHVCLGGLLHDAAEAYIGDIATPMKRELSIAGVPIFEIERRICDAIRVALQLPELTPAEEAAIHAADKAVLHSEAIRFGLPWCEADLVDRMTAGRIVGECPEDARGTFLAAWRGYRGD